MLYLINYAEEEDTDDNDDYTNDTDSDVEYVNHKDDGHVSPMRRCHTPFIDVSNNEMTQHQRISVSPQTVVKSSHTYQETPSNTRQLQYDSKTDNQKDLMKSILQTLPKTSRLEVIKHLMDDL